MAKRADIAGDMFRQKRAWNHRRHRGMAERELQCGGWKRHVVAGAHRLDPFHLGQDLRRRVSVTVARTRHRAGGGDARGECGANDKPYAVRGAAQRGNSLSRTSVSSNV
jgi:hypothetical protein